MYVIVSTPPESESVSINDLLFIYFLEQNF